VRARDCLTTAFALIDYLHELARAETGHIALSFEPCDLVPLAATMAQDYRASAAARGLAIEFASSSDHAFVETVQTRVRQILGNLVSNAIKYTSRGTVAIRVTVDPQRAAENGDGGGVRVEVADTGPGIPADKLEAIFDEFTRIGGDGTSGAGLGLAISERLAEALGGTIAVESELGRGSIFALHLPLAASTALVPGGSRSSPKDAHSGAGM
jgi:signal transduction histidine kinase